MSDCSYCVRYNSGPRRGEVFMRCLVHAVAASGGDVASIQTAATIMVGVENLR